MVGRYRRVVDWQSNCRPIVAAATSLLTYLSIMAAPWRRHRQWACRMSGGERHLTAARIWTCCQPPPPLSKDDPSVGRRTHGILAGDVGGRPVPARTEKRYTGGLRLSSPRGSIDARLCHADDSPSSWCDKDGRYGWTLALWQQHAFYLFIYLFIFLSLSLSLCSLFFQFPLTSDSWATRKSIKISRTKSASHSVATSVGLDVRYIRWQTCAIIAGQWCQSALSSAQEWQFGSQDVTISCNSSNAHKMRPMMELCKTPYRITMTFLKLVQLLPVLSE